MKTLFTLSNEYLDMRSDLGRFNALRRSTLKYYLHDFAQWLIEAAQVQRPDQLSSEIMHAWHRYACTKRCLRSGLPLQPMSAYTYVMNIRTFCLWLRKEGYVPEGLIENFPHTIEPRQRLQVALRHEEVRQYLDSLPMNTPKDILFRALAEFLYTSGARIGEAAQLNVADVDLAVGQARVLGKGRKERMVPIGRTARHHLEIYLAGVRPLFLKTKDELAFWVGPEGRRMSYYALRDRFRESARGLNGPPVRPHILRRSCATEMLRSGANVWAVKDLLGHEDLETIEHYALLDLNDLKEMHRRCHPRDLPHPPPFKP